MKGNNKNRIQQARSPLFNLVRRYLQCAKYADRFQLPIDESDALLRQQSLTRRELLAKAGVLGLAASLPSTLAFAAEKSRSSASITVIGAGIAGLTAAHYLKKANVRAQIYEASTRTGGRIMTRRDVLGAGITTEMGGEFIDTGHTEMLALAKEFHLDLIDRQTDPLPPGFFFNGEHHSQKQLLEALLPILRAVKSADYGNEDKAAKLDQLSLTQYLDQLGASGWSRKLIETAYTTEFGAEPDELSSLSFIDLFVDNDEHHIEMFGESDERFKIKGGNARLCDALTDRVKDQIEYGHRLVAIREKNKQFVAVFDVDKERTVEVKSDVLLLTIPFSVLRDVEIKIPLPSSKKKAIQELGYGNNSKICFGTSSRPWRDHGYNGETFADTSVQLCWDSSQLQDTQDGSLTAFLGGNNSRNSILKPAKQFVGDLEKCFPGFEKSLNGKFDRFYWSNHPLAKGSYPYYKVGQWTSLAGEEIKPVGQLFFAGDHCSESSQGYMNGGAETGRIAAQAILEKIRVK